MNTKTKIKALKNQIERAKVKESLNLLHEIALQKVAEVEKIKREIYSDFPVIFKTAGFFTTLGTGLKKLRTGYNTLRGGVRTVLNPEAEEAFNLLSKGIRKHIRTAGSHEEAIINAINDITSRMAKSDQERFFKGINKLLRSGGQVFSPGGRPLVVGKTRIVANPENIYNQLMRNRAYAGLKQVRRGAALYGPNPKIEAARKAEEAMRKQIELEKRQQTIRGVQTLGAMGLGAYMLRPQPPMVYGGAQQQVAPPVYVINTPKNTSA